MNIAQLRIMITLAECHNMSVAARRVFLSQPTITYQINAVEKELGFKVFKRGHTGTHLTEAGETFCDGARKALALYEQTVTKAVAIARTGQREVVRIGQTEDLSRLVNITLLHSRELFKDIDFRVFSYDPLDIIDKLCESAIDLCFCHDGALNHELLPKLKFEPLLNVGPTCVFSNRHHLSGRASISLTDLHGETLYLAPMGKVSRMSDDIRTHIASHEPQIKVRDYHRGEMMASVLLQDEAVALAEGDEEMPEPVGYATAQLEWPGHSVIGVACQYNDFERLSSVIALLKEEFGAYNK
jgi:DNA-binding transcriptional LysR family regulator